MKKKYLIFIISIVIASIFVNSLFGITSYQLSGKVTDYLSQFFHSNFSEFSVRKWAHVFEYFILGIFLMLLVKKLFLSISFVMWISFFDESIQMFQPMRHDRVEDIWIDVIGAVFGIFLIKLCSRK